MFMRNINDKIIFLLLVVFYPLLFVLSFFRKKKKTAVFNIVIVQLSRLGDLICTTPVYRLIKSQYPEAKITVVIKDSLVDVLKDNKHIDRIETVGNNYSTLELAKKIITGRYSHLIVFTPCIRIAAASILSLVSSRTSFMIEKFGRLNKYATLMSYHRYLPYVGAKYTVTQYLELIAEPLNLNIDNINSKNENYEIHSSGLDRGKIEQWLSKNNINTETDLIVGLGIVAGDKEKMWDRENFSALAKILIEKYRAKIIAIGIKSEEQYLNEFRDSVGSDQVYVSTDFSIGESAALLSQVKIFVAVDCGQLYLAHAAGTTVVDIIGSVDRDMYPPIGNRCLATKSQPIASTTVEEVLELVKELIR
jgi:ADP-heptose:LPS heptosyltransferase